VIDAPVQSHVETEGEEAHGVGFYEKRAQRAAARAIDAMPHPRWVSARRPYRCMIKMQTPTARMPKSARNRYALRSGVPRRFSALALMTDHTSRHPIALC
jgi:hypothetical protein